MRNIIIALLIPFLLIACQNTSQIVNIQPSQPPLIDDLFDQTDLIKVESEQDIFALNDEMKLMVQTKLKGERDNRARAVKLLNHIFDNESISLSYEANANITAIQTYQQHVANCLSLTIMAYALAEEANLNVKFQHVETPEYWVRNGQYNLLTGHVNLLIAKEKYDGYKLVWGSRDFQIDFDPQASHSTFKRKVIAKSTVLAMFYNNKGAEYLVSGDFNQAYQYFKSAVNTDPTFSAAWGNLGILYKFKGDYEAAKAAYAFAINLDNDNLTALENLAIIFSEENKVAEVEAIKARLNYNRLKNPYYHAMLADENYYNGNYNNSIKHYKKAIALERRAHEFYYGLAKVYYKTGKIEAAKNAIHKARKFNEFSDLDRLYLAKLNFLRNSHFD